MTTVQEQAANTPVIVHPMSPLLARVETIERHLYGDKQTDALGLIKRVSLIEDAIEELVSQERGRMAMLKGIAVGLALTTVFSGGSLLAMLQALAKVP